MQTLKITLLLLSQCLWLSACDQQIALSRIPGTISVVPPTLDFDAVAIGEIAEGVVQLSNTGQGEVTLTSVVLDPGQDDSFSIVDDLADFSGATLFSGDSLPVTVRFSPTATMASSGGLQAVFVAAAGNNSTRGQFFGIGGRPDLFCDPPVTDFARVEMGTSAVRTVQLRNAGSAELSLVVVSMDRSTGPFAFEVDPTVDLPFVLQPGQFADVE
jgi:hypothetical protein